MDYILQCSPKSLSGVLRLIDCGLKDRFAVRFRREMARLKREQEGIDSVRRLVLEEIADSSISFESVLGPWFDACAQKWVQAGKFDSFEEARAAIVRVTRREANSEDFNRIGGGVQVSPAGGPVDGTGEITP